MNRLGQEQSPYLKQHAHNPVDWYPWGEEAIAKAKAENRLVFLSIGYSTCYWCHVMEKECFESQEVGRALKEFVCIKVDREEHPDVDEIYMDAVTAMTGRGGWPLSVFLTPDLKPFWGGTYLPRGNFLQLIEQLERAWREAPEKIRGGGDQVLAALREEQAPPSESLPAQELFGRFLSQAHSRFDEENGGFGDAPKFPGSLALRLLLRLNHPEAIRVAESSLAAMAAGGIYDQIGGGFHRYSVDARWLVPHFEKMLYDNALLAVTYTEAYQRTGRSLFAGVARETIEYLLRDLRAPGGAFYAAEDAGDVGQEGEFYVWRYDELSSLEGFAEFHRHFAVIPEGNFERGKNVLCLGEPEDWEPSRRGGSQSVREDLLRLRNRRPRPHRDEKILTAWNGLALSALALGARVLREQAWLEAAWQQADWIHEHLWREGQLLRSYAGGVAKGRGAAADYAYLIEGLIELHQCGGRERDLLWARELQAVLDRDFWQEGYLSAARDEAHLIVRKKDRLDDALPSAAGVSVRNLLVLAQFFQDPSLRQRAQALVKDLQPWLEQHPFGCATALLGLDYQARGEPVAVVAGPADREMEGAWGRFQSCFPPVPVLCAPEGKLSLLPLADGKSNTESSVFLCRGGRCEPPVGLEQAWANLQQLPGEAHP